MTLITQCYLHFQHVKIIQKIHPKSAVFLKPKTIWSHLKSRIYYQKTFHNDYCIPHITIYHAENVCENSVKIKSKIFLRHHELSVSEKNVFVGKILFPAPAKTRRPCMYIQFHRFLSYIRCSRYIQSNKSKFIR